MKLLLREKRGRVHSVTMTKEFISKFYKKQLEEIGEILKNLYGINFSDDKRILAEQIFEVVQIFPGGWSKLSEEWATYAATILDSRDEFFEKLFNENKLPKVTTIFPLKYSIMLGKLPAFELLFFKEEPFNRGLISTFIRLAALFNSQKIEEILRKEFEVKR